MKPRHVAIAGPEYQTAQGRFQDYIDTTCGITSSETIKTTGS